MSKFLPAGRFFGDSVKARAVNGFKLNELVYPEGFGGTPPHSHECSLMKVTMRGTFTHGWEDGTTRISSPWTLDYCPAGIMHWHQSHRSQVRILVIEIGPSRVESIGSKTKFLSMPASLQGQRCRWLTSNLHRSLRQMDPLSAIETEGLLLLLLSEVMHRGDTKALAPHWLCQAQEIIRERFNEPLTLTEIAQAVGVHPVWLASGFQRRCHQTVGQMIRELRVEYASRQLVETRHSLAEIALETGFADQSHFSNVFHRMTGMTPSYFRATGMVARTFYSTGPVGHPSKAAAKG